MRGFLIVAVVLLAVCQGQAVADGLSPGENGGGEFVSPHRSSSDETKPVTPERAVVTPGEINVPGKGTLEVTTDPASPVASGSANSRAGFVRVVQQNHSRSSGGPRPRQLYAGPANPGRVLVAIRQRAGITRQQVEFALSREAKEQKRELKSDRGLLYNLTRRFNDFWSRRISAVEKESAATAAAVADLEATDIRHDRELGEMRSMFKNWDGRFWAIVACFALVLGCLLALARRRR